MKRNDVLSFMAGVRGDKECLFLLFFPRNRRRRWKQKWEDERHCKTRYRHTIEEMIAV